jgi:hypothetical protein
MATSLENCLVELVKQMGDYYASTTTSNGDSTGLNIVDTALEEKDDTWITPNTYTFLTSGTYDLEERKVRELQGSTLGLARAHGGQVASSVTYMVTRLFSPSDYRIALVNAAKAAFPYIHREIRDTSKVAGNWLRTGGMNVWTSTSYPDYWRVSSVTAAENTTAPYYLVPANAYSCKLSTAAGNLYTNNTLVPDLNMLAGQTVKLSAQLWCDTASCARLQIYDGTTTTSSSYHDGDSAWRDYTDPIEVEATIADEPTEITFRVCLDVATGTAYVTDARAISKHMGRIYIGDLSLAQDRPHQVFREQTRYSDREPWVRLHNYEIGKDNYLYIGDAPQNYRLRIEGIGYLDFYDTSDDVGTDWADTIAIDEPQLQILVAQAAIYLCRQMINPAPDSSTSEEWQRTLAYWQQELRYRQSKFSMPRPPVTVRWT